MKIPLEPKEKEVGVRDDQLSLYYQGSSNDTSASLELTFSCSNVEFEGSVSEDERVCRVHCTATQLRYFAPPVTVFVIERIMSVLFGHCRKYLAVTLWSLCSVPSFLAADNLCSSLLLLICVTVSSMFIV